MRKVKINDEIRACFEKFYKYKDRRWNQFSWKTIRQEEIDKLSQALQKLCHEDLTLKNVNDATQIHIIYNII